VRLCSPFERLHLEHMKPFAFVFPGQGSQSIGMLQAWSDAAEVRRTLAEAADVLGTDFVRLIDEGPKDLLDLTTNTQPAMLTAGVACFRAWTAETGLAPAVLAGHSLGEYAAWVAAGALAFTDALGLVRFRAEAMQEAVPIGVGAMAAILGLDAVVVARVCREVAGEIGEVVEAVNFNDPKQTVIAGTRLGVDRACTALKSAGAKRALPLSVSAPFHSSLMRPAAERLRERLEDIAFETPRIPVINNVDVSVIDEAGAIRDALYRQAFAPVRWVETIEAIRGRGVERIFECGPGRVLAGMVKRIDAGLTSAAVYDSATASQAQALAS
jgi:[acyl-carrier-protein] S-malonyltransferase